MGTVCFGPAVALVQRGSVVRGERWPTRVENFAASRLASPSILAACFVLRVFWFSIDDLPAQYVPIPLDIPRRYRHQTSRADL